MNVAVACARARMPLAWVGTALLVAGSVVSAWQLTVPGAAVLLLGLACYFRLGIVHREPFAVASPVNGRWRAVNSPADRVPSHGIIAYGQSHAVDLVHEPMDGSRPRFGWWPVMRRPEAFPTFGRPVHAPIDGLVVRARGGQRDHLSRNSWPALPYLLAEGVRELLGPSRIFGNRVILTTGDGVYAMLAHLRQKSVRVVEGQTVRAGDVVGECGNSGNSTEPHLHMQLMDHPNPLYAAGLPVAFHRFRVDAQERSGVPGKRQPFEASPHPPHQDPAK